MNTDYTLLLLNELIDLGSQGYGDFSIIKSEESDAYYIISVGKHKYYIHRFDQKSLMNAIIQIKVGIVNEKK